MSHKDKELTLESFTKHFHQNFLDYKEIGGIKKEYEFSRASLDLGIKEHFSPTTAQQRTNIINQFLRQEDLNVRKVSRGVYAYYDPDNLSLRLIFKTLDEAVRKIQNANIIVGENIHSAEELKKTCYVAYIAEEKLKTVRKELLDLVPEFAQELAHEQTIDIE